MEEIIKFIDPSLLLLVPALYMLGEAVKKTQIKHEFVPFINMAVGVLLASLWVLATKPISTYQEIAMAVFVAIVQGIICAGLATYYHQLKKQSSLLKSE